MKAAKNILTLQIILREQDLMVMQISIIYKFITDADSVPSIDQC